MAGPPFAFADHYQVVGHFHGVDPQETWRSEFTVQGQPGIVPQPGAAIVAAIEGYFHDNLRSDCTYVQTELRQWTFGPQPIAGRGSIWISPSNTPGFKPAAYGGQSPAGAQTGKEVVAFIKLLTTRGRNGKQFLRQLYDLQDIGAVAGSPWVVLATTRVNAASYNQVVATSVAPYLAVATSPPFITVVHFSAKAYNAAPGPATMPFSTAVTLMDLVGPSTNRPTRKNKR